MIVHDSPFQEDRDRKPFKASCKMYACIIINLANLESLKQICIICRKVFFQREGCENLIGEFQEKMEKVNCTFLQRDILLIHILLIQSLKAYSNATCLNNENDVIAAHNDYVYDIHAVNGMREKFYDQVENVERALYNICHN